ncbi:MAG: hypothetical protein HKP61_08310 [Dactylosporangium sp.]|nr:hypothetical protein [Dactylosporangium sp.]NNJ60940.1 hypothetical protein [Dactylosporangium sp.]
MTNAANRVLWTIIGLGLVAAGVLGVLASQDRLAGTDPGSPLLWPELLTWWRGHQPWGTIIVIGAGLIIAVLGVALLRAQMHRHGATPIPDLKIVGSDPEPRGRTTVRATALVRGLERDLARSARVVGATVALTGASQHPDVWIRLGVRGGDLADTGGLATLRDEIVRILDRFEVTSGVRVGRLEVTARVVSSGGSRVQ